MATIKEILEKDGYIWLGKVSGGFAAVHKVRHKEYNHVRAVKVIDSIIESTNDPQYKTYKSECEKLFLLSCGGHPNIVRIYRHMLLDNRAMVEMDYINGHSLIDYINRNKQFIPIDEVLKMLSDISSALAFCHVDIYKYCYDRVADNLPDDPNDASQVLIDDATRKRLIEKYRIVHNDMHDRNIMRREDGTYILLDFGLAVDNGEADRTSRIANGVYYFKAPEKWEGKPITASVDIYGFGVILYEYLTGELPFPFKGSKDNFEDLHNYKKKHCTETPREIFPLRKRAFETAHPGKTMEKPDYPQWLEHLIMKCLAKNPSDRYADGKELYDEVKGHLNCLWTQYHDILQRYNNLETEIKNCKSDTSSSTEYKELLQDYNQLKVEFNKYKIKDECLDNEQKRRINSLQKDLDNKNKEVTTLESQLKAEQDNSARLEELLSTAQSAIHSLNRQLQDLKNAKEDDYIELDVVNVIGNINKK